MNPCIFESKILRKWKNVELSNLHISSLKEIGGHLSCDSNFLATTTLAKTSWDIVANLVFSWRFQRNRGENIRLEPSDLPLPLIQCWEDGMAFKVEGGATSKEGAKNIIGSKRAEGGARTAGLLYRQMFLFF